MRGQALPVAVFCLATGAALGCLFLLFRGLSCLLGLKKWAAALLDALFCCLCGGFVFLCALAMDAGRLRLYQAALQALGAWCAVTALGPLWSRCTAALRKTFCRLWGLLAGTAGILRGFFHAGKGRRGLPGKKTGKKRKKPRKRT